LGADEGGPRHASPPGGGGGGDAGGDGGPILPPPGSARWPSPSRKAGDGTTILLEPAFGSHRPGSNAVLAFAEGYDLSIYLAFVESLRATDYDGDVVFSISVESRLKPGVRDYLRSVRPGPDGRGINVVAYEVEWTCFTQKGEPADGSREGMHPCRMDGAFGGGRGGAEAVDDPREPRPVPEDELADAHRRQGRLVPARPVRGAHGEGGRERRASPLRGECRRGQDRHVGLQPQVADDRVREEGDRAVPRGAGHMLGVDDRQPGRHRDVPPRDGGRVRRHALQAEGVRPGISQLPLLLEEARPGRGRRRGNIVADRARAGEGHHKQPGRAPDQAAEGVGHVRPGEGAGPELGRFHEQGGPPDGQGQGGQRHDKAQEERVRAETEDLTKIALLFIIYESE
ncbi:hypothetical protein THAOC_09236, partial [Thalassiosira oceanica]